MEWYNVVGFFTLMVIVRFVLNYYKLKRISHLHDKYIEYLQTDKLDFLQSTEEIKSLFKDAGLKDSGVRYTDSLGFGNFSTEIVSVWGNLANKRVDIVANVRMRFNEAIGVYKKRYKESFNPIFWLDFIIRFPKYFFEYFGVLPEKIAVKIFQVVYWIIAILLGIRKFELFDYLIN